MIANVLVLNLNHEPLNICNYRRALGLILTGKAVVLETNGQLLRSERLTLQMPSVVRLAYQVRRPVPELRLSRRSILARDDYTCQYCGRRRRGLTVDHVIPRHAGGEHSWENLVCCCTLCNNIKGNRTPKEAGLRLRRPPRRPRYIPFISYTTFHSALQNDQWRDYLAPFAPRIGRS